MSYIQIEIGGKLRGLKFNQMAITIMAQEIDHKYYAATYYYAMCFGGLCANVYAKGEERDFTYEDVQDWVEKVSKDTLEKVRAVLENTEKYKELLPTEEVVPDKKKLKSTTKNVLK